MIYVKDFIPYGFENVNRNIERDNNAHLNFLRKYIIQQGRLKQEEVDMFINSLLSDAVCKQEITDGYKMKDKETEDIVIEAEKKFKPSYRLEGKKNDTEEMKKIGNIRKRFLNQKKEKSYKKSPKYINKEIYENKYKSIVSSFDTRDVGLNQILELSIVNLLEDILYESIKDNKDIVSTKVIKTHEYDDVMAHTDYIIEVEYHGRKERGAYDLSTSTNEEKMENKGRLKDVICPYFNFNKGITFTIPRSLMIINDKEFLFQYLRKYMEEIKKTGEMKPRKALEIFENIGIKGKELKNNITNQLFKNISLN